MRANLRRALEAALGSKTEEATPVSGGDINDAYRVALEGKTAVFVKTHASAPPGMYEAEADGLGWLDESKALRIPKVLAYSDEEPAFLAIEWLAPGRPNPGFESALGQGLAMLHRSGAPSFGHRRDNFIGRLPQDNQSNDTWASFYWERRLEPQIRLAVDRGLLRDTTRSACRALEARIAERTGAPEPPARLHGDLWGGNLHADADGQPCLIDPAVYGGHREVDLAMMRLFGGFGTRVFDAYEEAFPLERGARERVPLYQLYPLLVHVNLFGGGYESAVERALRAVL
ncbi:MAG: fructosamine kinase family protein [Myxococcota bacterium]